MPLASYSDANDWLDETKLKFSSEQHAEGDANNADNIVKSYLSIRWPDRVPRWDAEPSGNQEATPQVVREAASLLMASYYYARRYSEETQDESTFARRLERRAINLLERLRDGEIDLWDKDYGAGNTDLDLKHGDFYPDDSATVLAAVFGDHDESIGYVEVSDRKFSMRDPF